jgi:hypothetical protein
MKNVTNMDQQNSDESINRQHKVFMYKSQTDRHSFLASYFKEGLEARRLCVFVSPEPKEKVIEDFGTHGLDVSSALVTGAFRLYDMQETYLPHGEFVTGFMMRNVERFIHDAKELGYTGLYTAGEMSWVYQQSHFWHELEEYESEVNALQRRHRTFTALCLYPTNRSAVIEGIVMRTHPLEATTDGVRVNERYVELQ